MNKIIKWAGLLFLPIFIFILALFLNKVTVGYFIVQKVAQFYAGKADIILEIGRISGNLFSETTVTRLSVRPGDGQPQAYHFKAPSITCTYNLWDLKEGYELFLEGLSCRVDTPEFIQDFSISIHEEEAETELKTFLLPAVLPRLDLDNGSIILTNPEWDVEIRRIKGRLQSSAAVFHELQLAAEDFRFSQQGEIKINTSFRASLNYSAAKLSIDSLKVGEDKISLMGIVDLARMGDGHVGFGADLEFAGSLMNIAGSLDNKLLNVQVTTQDFDIGELQQRLGGTGWDVAGKIKAETKLTVDLETLEKINGSFVVDVLHGRLHGVDIEAVSAAGSFDDQTFHISAAEARTPGNHVLFKDVSAPMPLLQEGEIVSILGHSNAQFSADIADIGTLLQLAGIKENYLPEAVRPESLTIQGHLEKGLLFLDEAGAAAVDFSLVADRATIPIPATPEAFETMPIDLSARLESSNLKGLVGHFGDILLNGKASLDISIGGMIREPKAKINLIGEDLTFHEIQLGRLSLQGDVRLMQEKLGKIQSIEFEITEMVQENGTGMLSLLSPVTGAWQGETLAMSAAFQLDGKGEILTKISRSPGKEIVLEISTRSLDSDGWLGEYIDKQYFFRGADIEAVLQGLYEETQLQVSGIIREAGATGIPFPLTGSFALQYSPKGVEISEFTWTSLERNQLTMKGFLPYDPMAEEPFIDNELSLKGHIDFPALEDVAVFLEPWGIGRGSVAIDMDVSGTWNEPEGHIHFQADGLEPPRRIRSYMDSPANISFDMAALGGAIVLQAATLESEQYSARATGSWRHGISVRQLLQRRKAELKGMIGADVTVEFKDLNFLRQHLSWLRRFEGDMRGEVNVSGPINSPVIKGGFSLKDGEMSHTFNFPMLSAINLQGEFDEDSITIHKMQSEAGGSPVNLNGRISRKAEAVEVSLHVDGRNVLLFRNNDMRIRGDVQLDVSGPLERLMITGTTGLTSGYYTRNIDFIGMIGSSAAPVSEGVGLLFSFRDPPLKDARLDIKITTIEPFRIRNNLIRGALRPELSLRGTGELPFLVGAVYIDPSRVILPSGRLQVQSGLLRFLEGEPDRPQLDLVAQSRILGYDINLVTQGPLDDPVITLSSNPALPNEDLLLLLLTGQPPRRDVAGGAQSRGATNVMVYLGRDFLNQWLEDESGATDESILDRFELDFGRDVTKSGEQTIESSFRLSEYTAGTGRILYLAGEKDKYDAYNYGLRVVFRFE